MKKHFLYILISLGFILNSIASFCQVWFPNGLYTGKQPHILNSDNTGLNLISINRMVNSRANYTIHQFRNGRWIEHSNIILENSDTITDIIHHNNSLYISGKFQIAGENYCLAKYDNNKWEGIFQPNITLSDESIIYDLEIANNKLIIAGSFRNLNTQIVQNIGFYQNNRVVNITQNFVNASPNGAIKQVKFHNNTLGIIGDFDTILNQNAYGFALINLSDLGNHFFSQLRTKYFNHIVHNTFGTYVAHNNRIYEFKDSLYLFNQGFDSIGRITSLAATDDRLVISGQFKLNLASKSSQIISFQNNIWIDITYNFRYVGIVTTFRNDIFGFNRRIQSQIDDFQTPYVINKLFSNGGFLRVKVGVDMTDDCNLGNNDFMLRNIPVFLNNNQISFTNENGIAHFLIDKNQSYNISTRVRRTFSYQPCSDSLNSYNFPQNQIIDSVEFILRRRQNIRSVDLSINNIQGGRILTRKATNYQVICNNTGSLPINGFVYLKKVKELDIITTIPQAEIINDTLIRWRLDALPELQQQSFILSVEPDLDETVSKNILTETFLQLDANESLNEGNDRDFIYQSTVGVDGPFRKYVSPNAESSDSFALVEMDKQIRFDIVVDNYSSDTVNHIVITDTLDLNLNIAEIIEIGSNKSYTTRVFSDPNNQFKGIIVWTFEDVGLWPNPQQAGDHQMSKVNIGFRVKLKNNSVGEMISNKAQIEMNNQFAGETNTVYCKVVDSLANVIHPKLHEANIQLFPNPTDGIFHISSEELIVELELINAQGQRLIQHQIHANHSEINLNNYVDGVYFLKVKTTNNQWVMKKLILVKK
jgi:uncharacterized repeat protein (TIGR01451 family)